MDTFALNLSIKVMDGEKPEQGIKAFDDFAYRSLVPLVRRSTSFWRLLRRDFSTGGADPQNVKTMIAKLRKTANNVFLSGKMIESVLDDSTKSRFRSFIPEEIFSGGNKYLENENPSFENCCYIIRELVLVQYSSLIDDSTPYHLIDAEMVLSD